MTDVTDRPTVDADRLWADLEANGAFGAVVEEPPQQWGRTVRCGTDANREAREFLLERMTAAGLDVRIDAVGNVAGRWTPESADPEAAPIAAGSHLDSVPEGGIFDGPLGVYAALEAVRAMQDAGLDPDRPIEVVSFTEEEGGRFADGLLGSSVAVGARRVDEALELEDESGTTLAAALENIGFVGEGRLDAAEWDAWLELHVEQHTELESAGVPAGVVTDITGITHCEVTVEGDADHAGSTPMGERTDALAAASEFVLEVERAAEARAETDPAAVGTVGSLDVSPNATNVVPGRTEAGLDVRSTDYESMEHIVGVAREELERLEADRGVDTALERPFDLEPTPMAERCRTALHEAGEAAGIETLSLHSGAAHDSMYVANVTDAGMLFAPSRDGVSHNPREWTSKADCADATRVLAGALAELAGV
ncbi:M20 family metallo-hydrolase [Natronomonas sp. CBA1123]|uniref:M20 family metallo-hydrolase n=1 Tax=Natronomonas sp. CBA1123 TaxID=2668070 RepID=UPI00351B62E9